MCPNKDFNVSEFMSLLKQGVRLNIHDKIDHSVTNGIIVVYSMAVCPMLFHYRMAIVHSGRSAGVN